MADETVRTKEGGAGSSLPPVSSHFEQSSLITPEKLDGTNYVEWALNAQNKIKGRKRWGFITGSKAAPKDVDSVEYETWDEENCLVKSWLLDAMTRDIRSMFLCLNTAKEIWDGLQLTYSVGQDASKAYQLHCEVFSIRQAGDSVVMFFGKLQKLWQDIDAIEPCTMECTRDIERYNTIVNSHRLYVFLAGLDSYLDGARGRILAMYPLPKLQAAYAMVCQEANRQDAMLGVSHSQAGGAVMVSKKSFNRFDLKKPGARKCTHCNKENHVAETCFKLHGYPEWHPRGKKASSDSKIEEHASKGHSVPASGFTAKTESTDSGTCLISLKILSYNVWFREDLEMFKRMKALGDLIQLHSPDIICFQEVTPNIYDIFQHSSWWKLYHCSVSKEMANLKPYFCMQLSKLPVKSFSCKPFSNSIMGRELCVVDSEVQSSKQLVVATSHLESPCPAPPKWDQMFSKERVSQAAEALNFLKRYPNVMFCGDMNWDDKLDGQFPLPEGWLDAWAELRPRENGWTYDTKSNQMLSGNRTLQKRLDRFVCNLRDFKITEINMIGMEAIPGLTYLKEKKVRKEMQKLVLPVLPSDHFGLLLTICSQ